MRQLRNETLVLKQLQNHAVAEAEASAGLRLAAKSGQKLIVAAAPKNCPQLPGPISALKHSSCRQDK